MRRHEIDHAVPKPRRRIQGLAAIPAQFGQPLAAFPPRHLSRMPAADDPGEEFRHINGFLAGQCFDLELQILRQQFADEDRLLQDSAPRACGRRETATSDARRRPPVRRCRPAFRRFRCGGQPRRRLPSHPSGSDAPLCRDRPRAAQPGAGAPANCSPFANRRRPAPAPRHRPRASAARSRACAWLPRQRGLRRRHALRTSSGQKRLPRGIRGSLPSIRSSARCFQDRPAARRIASLTVSGMSLPRSTVSPRASGAKADS